MGPFRRPPSCSNELDLANAEFGEKVSKLRGPITFMGAGAIFMIPTLVMGLGNDPDPDPDPDNHHRCDDHQQVNRQPCGYALLRCLSHGLVPPARIFAMEVCEWQ